MNGLLIINWNNFNKWIMRFKLVEWVENMVVFTDLTIFKINLFSNILLLLIKFYIFAMLLIKWVPKELG